MASDQKVIVRTLSRKAYLSRTGHRNLGDLLGHLTWLWNVALHRRKTAWETEQRSVSYYDQSKELTVTRRDPGWSRFPVAAQRSVLQRLDRSYKVFYKRGGYPRFKGPNRGIRSFELVTPIKTNGKWSWVGIKGVGRVRFKGTPPEGAVKLIRIVRTVRRVKIQVVTERLAEIEPDSRPMVGVDLGIKSRVALSTGTTVPGVRLDRRELKLRQRRLSRARLGACAAEAQCG